MLNRVASHSRLAVESPIFIRVENMQKCMILCQLCVCIGRESTIRFDSNESHPTTLHVHV